jgi:hypothetical protein
MFTVQTATTSTGLTTLAAVKAELQITGNAEDAYLEEQILRVSAAITTYLNVATSNTGSRTLFKETLVETVRYPVKRMVLSRYPVTSIASLVEDGTTVDPTLYEVDGAYGIVTRYDANSYKRDWCFRKCVITYDGGFATIPKDIEDACIGIIKGVRSARTRDPLVKSEDIPGVLSTTYWVGAVGQAQGEFPPEIAAKLDGYRNIPI